MNIAGRLPKNIHNRPHEPSFEMKENKAMNQINKLRTCYFERKSSKNKALLRLNVRYEMIKNSNPKEIEIISLRHHLDTLHFQLVNVF